MAFPDGWNRRVEISLDDTNVDSDLTDFRLLLTEASLPSEMLDADGDFPAQFGGGDIRASSDSAGTTQLALEVVTFVTDNTPANGKALLFVKVPSVLAASGGSIWLWYNTSGFEFQPTPSSTFGAESVWSSEFVGVWHLQGAFARTPEDIRYVGGPHVSNPAIADGGTSDDTIREHGNAVWDPNTSQYLTVYTGKDSSGNERVHGATSPDGINWTKTTQQPLIPNQALEDPYLLIDGSTYYIYAENKSNETSIALRSHSTFDDDWDASGTSHGDTLDPGAAAEWDEDGVSSPTVWKEGSTYYMLYEGHDNGVVGQFEPAEMGLATASSPTGPWTREATNPVFVPADTSWVDDTIVPDDIWKDPDGFYHLAYHAPTPGGDWRIGYAKSTSADDLTAWTDGSHNPIDTDIADSAQADAWTFVPFEHGGLGYLFGAADADGGIHFGYGLDEFGHQSGRAKDSAGGRDATIQAAIGVDDLFQDGAFGRAINFAGTSGSDGSYLSVPDEAALRLAGDIYVSAWVEGDTDPEDTGAREFILRKGDAYALIWRHTNSTEAKAFQYKDDGDTFHTYQDTTNLAASTFYLFTGRHESDDDGDSLDRDGASRDSGTGGALDSTITNDLLIGTAGGAFEFPFDGRLHGVWLASEDFGIAWSKAAYHNQSAPGTFATAGTPEAVGGRDVEAETASIQSSAQASNVNAERGVQSAVEQVSASAQAATVARDRGVSAASEAVSALAQDAVVSTDRGVLAGQESLAATAQSATVETGGDRAVSAETESTSIEAQQATVSRDRGVSAGVESAEVEGQAASVVSGRGISAGTESVSAEAQQALINRTREISADAESLGLTAHQATVVRGELFSIIGAQATSLAETSPGASVREVRGKKASLN